MYGQSRILIIGSDETETRRIGFWLGQHRHEVITARDWMRGLRELYSWRPQAVIILAPLDGSVPWDEVQVVRNLSDMPVVVVADKATRANLQTALDLGIAGFLVRPLEAQKLMERLLPALERQTSASARQLKFSCDNLTIDWRRFEVRIDGKVVRLSPIEFKLLSLLVERRGEVVSYGEILARVWGPNYDLSERRNVKLYIWYLRQKLEINPSRPRLIQTKNGIGYMFNSDDIADREDTVPEDTKPADLLFVAS